MNSDTGFRNFWQDTAEAPKPIKEEKKKAEINADIIVVGGSIAALTTALVLQQEGKKCVVLAPVNLINANAETAHLISIPATYSLHNKNMSREMVQLIAKSEREAIDLVEGLITKYNIDCDFAYQTGYLFAHTNDQAEILEQTNAIARDAGVVSTATDHIPVPLPFSKAYRFDFQAQLHPLKYLLGLATALEAEGGVILTKCFVTSVTNNGERITVHTTAGNIQASLIVYADDNIKENKTPLLHIPKCCYNVAFTLKKELYPDGIAYDMSLPGHSFSTYAADGQKYIVATGFGNNNREDVISAFADLEAYLRKYFDVDRVTHKWISQYYAGKDDLPSAGKLPGHNNSYIISGLGNNAIAYGSIAAKIVCSLMYRKHSGYEELYSPDRLLNETV